MKIKALITTLVLGSSSAAMARPVSVSAHGNWTFGTAPVVVRDHRASTDDDCVHDGLPAPLPPPVVRPARYDDRWYQRRRSWVSLGGMNRIADGEMSFDVSGDREGDGDGPRFSTLKLRRTAGKSLIYRVVIHFANGETQVAELNRYLNAANPTIAIDLNGRERSISNVTVIGRNARQSSYSVLAA